MQTKTSFTEHSVSMTGWSVLGAGAIGGLFAAQLQRHGSRVQIILRSSTPLTDYLEHGLQVYPSEPHGKPWSVRPMPRHPEEITQQSIQQLLITTKAYQTEAAVQSIVPALHPSAIIVLLQNGMGVLDAIRPLLPPTVRLVQGVTTEGVWRRHATELVHAGRGHTLLGPLFGDMDAVHTVANQWRAAGIDVRPEPDIIAPLWRKLAINCVINPFTALYQCRNGALPQYAEWRARQRLILNEIKTLAACMGHPNVLSNIETEVNQVIVATAANHSSMLQDIRAGRTTEIDFMNGFVAARSRALGLNAPENQRLTIAIHALSAAARV